MTPAKMREMAQNTRVLELLGTLHDAGFRIFEWYQVGPTLMLKAIHPEKIIRSSGWTPVEALESAVEVITQQAS